MDSLTPQRSFGRSVSQMRPVSFERNVMKHAAGSCLVKFGDTHVLVSASIEEGVPPWRRSSHEGWVTAEYSMLPAATHKRSRREINGQKGRSQEIQRLVGRSLRTVCDMKNMGEITVTIDCDVIQADGGTRTAAVTGGWIALHDAMSMWVEAGKIPRIPIRDQVAAVSVGMVKGSELVDLDYSEDSNAEIDMNLVATGSGEFIEIQGTGERTPFDRSRLNRLLDLGEASLQELLLLQDAAVGWTD